MLKTYQENWHVQHVKKCLVLFDHSPQKAHTHFTYRIYLSSQELLSAIRMMKIEKKNYFKPICLFQIALISLSTQNPSIEMEKNLSN